MCPYCGKRDDCECVLFDVVQGVRVNLNIYDTKTIRCVICDKPIREVNYDAELIRPKCGQCSNPIPDTKDKMHYLIYH